MALPDLRPLVNIGVCNFGIPNMSTNHTPARLRLLGSVMLLLCLQTNAATAAAAPLRDGAHDFDFLIGDWKVHLRRLPNRLVGSNKWIEYGGISRHKKILGSN